MPAVGALGLFSLLFSALHLVIGKASSLSPRSPCPQGPAVSLGYRSEWKTAAAPITPLRGRKQLPGGKAVAKPHTPAPSSCSHPSSIREALIPVFPTPILASTPCPHRAGAGGHVEPCESQEGILLPPFFGEGPLPSALCPPREMHPQPLLWKTPQNSLPCHVHRPESSLKILVSTKIQQLRSSCQRRRPGQHSPSWGSVLQCPTREQREDRTEAGNVLSQPQGH